MMSLLEFAFRNVWTFSGMVYLSLWAAVLVLSAWKFLLDAIVDWRAVGRPRCPTMDDDDWGGPDDWVGPNDDPEREARERADKTLNYPQADAFSN